MPNRSVRLFPAFDRSFFSDPKKLFEGWTVERFQDLANEIVAGWEDCVYEEGSDFRFTPDGWLNNGSVNDLGNYWIVFFDDASMKDMFFVPYGLNRVLFPYNVTFSSSEGVKFSNSDIYRNVGGDQVLRKVLDYPQGLLGEGMRDVDLSLPIALLVQGFAGYCVEDEMVPVSELRLSDEQVNLLVNEGLPFPVLLEALLVLWEGLGEKVVYGRVNLINLAMKIHSLGVGV